MNPQLLNLVINLALILLAGLIILALIFVFWTAWYIPIHKELQYDEKVKELNREYELLDAKTKRREEDSKAEEDKYRMLAASNHNLELEVRNKTRQVNTLDKTLNDLKDLLEHPEKLVNSNKTKKGSSSKKPLELSDMSENTDENK